MSPIGTVNSLLGMLQSVRQTNGGGNSMLSRNQGTTGDFASSLALRVASIQSASFKLVDRNRCSATTTLRQTSISWAH